jgi:DNA-binding transcriptional LysR family regulator
MKTQNLEEPSNTIRCDSPFLMLELMQRTDRLCVGPAMLFSDPMLGQGLARIKVEPVPPPMSLGLITLRGIPLQRPARQLASMIARHLHHGNEGLEVP